MFSCKLTVKVVHKQWNLKDNKILVLVQWFLTQLINFVNKYSIIAEFPPVYPSLVNTPSISSDDKYHHLIPHTHTPHINDKTSIVLSKIKVLHWKIQKHTPLPLKAHIVMPWKKTCERVQPQKVKKYDRQRLENPPEFLILLLPNQNFDPSRNTL